MQFPNEANPQDAAGKNANRSANIGCLLLLIAFFIIASAFGLGAAYEYRRIKSGAPAQPFPTQVPQVPAKP